MRITNVIKAIWSSTLGATLTDKELARERESQLEKYRAYQAARLSGGCNRNEHPYLSQIDTLFNIS